MSDADTIRNAINRDRNNVVQRSDALDALDALVAIIEQQADRIAWLEGDVAQRRIEEQRLRDAATACLLQWAQGRGIPPRLTSEEVALRDALGLDMEIFGDEHRKLLSALDGTPTEATT